jgi:Fur family transcriptional regulator, ferric uptake regulator
MHQPLRQEKVGKVQFKYPYPYSCPYGVDDVEKLSQMKNDALLTRAQKLLKGAHLKVTTSRQSVLQLLMKDHGPLTVDQILRSLKDCDCDLVTVYRVVQALEKARIISRCDFGDGISRYEFTESHQGHHHHHVICKSCRQVEPLDLCVDQKWEKKLAARGYSDLTHRLEFFGLCKECL